MKKQHMYRIVSGIVLGATLTLTSLLPAAVPADPASDGGQLLHKKEKARDGAKPAVEKSSEGRKLPFHGKLIAVDPKENTITLTYSTGEKQYHITSDTEILKYDQPATLADAVLGEQVSGAYIRINDRMELTKLTLAKKNPLKGSAPKTDPKEVKDTPQEVNK